MAGMCISPTVAGTIKRVGETGHQRLRHGSIAINVCIGVISIKVVMITGMQTPTEFGLRILNAVQEGSESTDQFNSLVDIG